MKKMARIVDDQNSRDPNYIRMSDDFDKSIGKTLYPIIIESLQLVNNLNFEDAKSRI